MQVELYYDGQSIIINIPENMTDPESIKKYIDNELKSMVSLFIIETELTETRSNLDLDIKVKLNDASSRGTLARLFEED